MKVIEGDRSWNRKLCDLMYHSSMPADIEIAYTREPDFFTTLELQGNRDNKVFLGIQKEQLLICGTVNTKELFINGKPHPLVYLGGLRKNPGQRAAMAMGKILKHYKEYISKQKSPVHFSTIVEGNNYAQKMYTSHGSYLPPFHDRGIINTYAINVNKRKRFRSDSKFSIKRGDSFKPEEIITFLNNEGKRKQFYPVYTEDFFKKAANFSIKDFYLACRGDEILGVTAPWDQGAFKQNLIKRYHGIYKIFKGVINLFLKMGGYRPLPREGAKLNSLYICFTAIKKNNTKIFKALLDRLYLDNRDKGYHYYLLGLHEKDPLQSVVKDYFTITYKSRLYLFDWEEQGELPGKRIPLISKALVPYMEIALL